MDAYVKSAKNCIHKLSLIKMMALSSVMLVVMGCDTPSNTRSNNSFVKGFDKYGTHMTAFCFSSTKEKCIDYMEANCRQAAITSISLSSGDPSLITVFGTCLE
jgi:hypothetical protein